MKKTASRKLTLNKATLTELASGGIPVTMQRMGPTGLSCAGCSESCTTQPEVPGSCSYHWVGMYD